MPSPDEVILIQKVHEAKTYLADKEAAKVFRVTERIKKLLELEDLASRVPAPTVGEVEQPGDTHKNPDAPVMPERLEDGAWSDDPKNIEADTKRRKGEEGRIFLDRPKKVGTNGPLQRNIEYKRKNRG